MWSSSSGSYSISNLGKFYSIKIANNWFLLSNLSNQLILCKAKFLFTCLKAFIWKMLIITRYLLRKQIRSTSRIVSGRKNWQTYMTKRSTGPLSCETNVNSKDLWSWNQYIKQPFHKVSLLSCKRACQAMTYVHSMNYVWLMFISWLVTYVHSMTCKLYTFHEFIQWLVFNLTCPVRLYKSKCARFFSFSFISGLKSV